MCISDIMIGLNSSQQKAIETTKGPIIIIAGPGTGKTTTLVERIAYLIQKKKISPDKICALTFTTKAAHEISERLENSHNALPWNGTFHSLGYELIRQPGDELKIISGTERKAMLRDVRQEISQGKTSFIKSYPLREFELKLSRYKQDRAVGKKIPHDWVQALDEYNKRLREAGFIDYDDIFVLAYQYLQKQLKGNKKDKRNDKNGDSNFGEFEYILVDEFQDTNYLQYACIRLLAGTRSHVFVIGDPLQSIYAFQGAYPDIFNIIKGDSPDYTEIILDTNYRSSRAIVTASSRLFTDSAVPHANRDDSGSVMILHTIDEFTEATWIVSEIE